MRRIILYLLLLLIAAPIAAQNGSDWSAWLETDDGYIRVFSNGQTRTTTLNLPDGYTLWSRPNPSNNGDLFAFCATADGLFHALIYDTTVEATIYDYTLGIADGCHTMLDDTNTRMAVVLTLGNLPFRDLTWWMLVIDTHDSEVVAQIEWADDHAGSYSWGYGPLLENFHDDVVTIMGADLGGPYARAYTWSLSQNMIDQIPIPLYPDHLPSTNEYLWRWIDDALPYVQFYGEGFHANVIQVSGNDGNPQNLFHSPYKLITASEFIDDGRKIAIGISEENQQHWLYIDRAGNQFALPRDLPTSYPNIRGTSDGFAFLRSSDDGYERLIYYRFDGNQIERRVLWWKSVVKNVSQIMWITPMEGQSDMEPLANLDMITLDEPPPAPTPIPPTWTPGQG